MTSVGQHTKGVNDQVERPLGLQSWLLTPWGVLTSSMLQVVCRGANCLRCSMFGQLFFHCEQLLKKVIFPLTKQSSGWLLQCFNWNVYWGANCLCCCLSLEISLNFQAFFAECLCFDCNWYLSSLSSKNIFLGILMEKTIEKMIRLRTKRTYLTSGL